MNEQNGIRQSRRGLLTVLTGAGGAMLLGNTVLARPALAQATAPGRTEDAPDPRVARIIAATITVDTHNHTPPYPFAPDPAASPVSIDLKGMMRKAGFSAVCYTYPVNRLRTPKPGDWYDYHTRWLTEIDRLLAANDVRRALTLADLEAAQSRREPVVIQASEGAQWIEGRLERIEESYGRGMRHLQPVHQMDDLVAPFGAAQQLVLPTGSAPGTAARVSGLTEFGERVIRECNRLGMVVDMAHTDEPTVLAAIKVARAPVMVSHTALDTPVSRSDRLYASDPGLVARLVTPTYAKAVAEAGGLMGIWRIFPTVKDYVTAVKQMADMVGVDHTCIGSDTSVAPGGGGIDTNAIWPDQKGGFLPAVVREMLAQGFREDEISKIIGGNYCRYFGQVTQRRT
jgi:membrane dipeptidase